MKLEFHGHNERYTVEQSLLNLFPGELPVYEPIRLQEDKNWAIVSCREEETPVSYTHLRAHETDS